MIAPRGLIGAALVLWGLSTGFLPVAIVLALAYEGARFAPPSPAAARRVTLVGRVVLFAVLAKLAYAALTTAFPEALYIWLKWLPILLLPLPIVQALAGGAISSDALPAPLRPGRNETREVDTTYVYAAITLIGAGTGAKFPDWYFFGAAAIVAWALVARMPARTRLPGAVMLAMGVGMGHAVHVGVSELQNQVEAWSEDLIIDFMSAKADAMKERTRIGDLGKVKLSDRILMRVIPHGPRNLVLLREAAFDRYQNGTWQNSSHAYKPVRGERDRWIVRPGEAERSLTIKRTLPGGEGVLALPQGTHAISKLPALTMGVLPNGTVRASGSPYLISMAVTYDERLEVEAPGDPSDLVLPASLEPALDQVIREEGLDRATPVERLRAVQALFATKFAYSLILSDPKDPAKGRGITDFLLRDRKGHCEYFGTATVLLLRRLGIPARYAVGYSVQDWSDLERAFVVRNRHAHAWTVAYVEGRWIEVDTTPASWATSEAEEARSPFGPLLDAFSWLWDRIVDFWVERSWPEIAGAIAAIFGGAAALVGAVVLWRRRRPKVKHAATDKLGRAWRALEARLARRGYARAPDETPLAWARRLHASGSESWRAELLDLAKRYYRTRFDPDIDVSKHGFDVARAADRFPSIGFSE
jgi:transglutaminase-like putative cysteine protease